MTIKMLINAVEAEEYRVAIVKDGILDAFYIESVSSEHIKRNIYKGIIERVEPSLQACFVNYGGERNGFLQLSEVHPEYFSGREGEEPSGEQSNPRIEKVLKKGQEVLVQVLREMPGKKGAQLSTFLSFASRFVVLTPGKTTGGVSKKIEDDKERQRLKSIMAEFKFPEGVGYIVRTAALKQNKKVLSRDVNRLLRMWKSIKKDVKDMPALSLIHKEEDICLRTLRDYFTGEIGEVLVDDKMTFIKVKDYMKIISPKHQRRVKLYKEKRPLFSHYEIEKQIEEIYSEKVPLKSGGSIVIDPTEALVAIDVNSGRGRLGKDVETTAFNTNKEAAFEITRQLKLRDMGGLIVIDFIDMRDRGHNREIEKIVRDEVRTDQAKIDVAGISKFGLMELSRERLRPSLESKSYQTCPYCLGRGLVQSVESASLSFLRRIWMGASKKGVVQVKGELPVEVGTYLQNRKRKEISGFESRYGVDVTLEVNPSLPLGGGKLEFIKETSE